MSKFAHFCKNSPGKDFFHKEKESYEAVKINFRGACFFETTRQFIQIVKEDPPYYFFGYMVHLGVVILTIYK